MQGVQGDPQVAMRWFGESWGAPVNETNERMGVPLGRQCIACGIAFQPDDQGIETPAVGFKWPTVIYHKDCFMRSILGPAHGMPET